MYEECKEHMMGLLETATTKKPFCINYSTENIKGAIYNYAKA